jgi:hypothetical protein
MGVAATGGESGKRARRPDLWAVEGGGEGREPRRARAAGASR